ncbi:hypothetical protein M406DRAFT_247915 [Cryphonectria parasitica EP155]|uniref:Uncharacterized protein n=1 Tax=Cryphonectria parasitica (strain ATCC 38755 / EP155) TaxID=660469 RepID=A0A9P5CTG4_CRYP1|nr:uncharacterized protein M406DRAFT_247915 [Cryphonectria parasitica EP155]KAF3770614.1 hypothetical protein M406DRAFT_247915 [Cryphonectria parasitica EP155]
MHDLAFLIEILNRINKFCICKSSSVPKSIQDRDFLISCFLENFIKMLIYSYCKNCDFRFCKIFSGDSSRYIECI